MKYLTQKEAQEHFDKGYILQNRQNQRIFPLTFKLLGKVYTSNSKRALAGRPYKFDSNYWVVYDKGLLTKVVLLWNRVMHKIQKRKSNAN